MHKVPNTSNSTAPRVASSAGSAVTPARLGTRIAARTANPVAASAGIPARSGRNMDVPSTRAVVVNT